MNSNLDVSDPYADPAIDPNNSDTPQPASIAFTPAGPITFANTVINTTSTARTFTVNNSGDVATFTCIASLTGTNPDQFLLSGPNSCNAGIAAHGSCTGLSVSAKPTATTTEGTKTASLELACNNNTLIKTVALSYNAQASAPPGGGIDLSGYTLTYQNGYDTSTDINANQLGFGSISTTIVKSGTGSFDSYLKAGMAPISSGWRSEQQYDDAAQNPTEGAVEYDEYFQNWTNSGWGGSCIQWHPNNNNSATSFLYCTENTINIARSLGSTNFYMDGDPSAGTAITSNTWIHFTWKFKWSSGSDGYIQFYINNSATPYSTFNGATQDSDGQPYLKVGQNHWPSSPTRDYHTFYDNLKVYKKN